MKLAIRWTLLSLVLAGVVGRGLPFAHAVTEGQPAPTFVLPDQTGAEIALPALQGKVVYLDFWASWCAPCKESLPFMNELQQKFADRGLAVLAVNLDTNRERAQALMAKVSPQYRVLFDPKGAVAKEYALPTMPTSYIIDRAGVVRVVHPKFTPEDRAAIVAAVESALGGNK